MTTDDAESQTQTRQIDLGALVRNAWGKDWGRPETGYLFSGGRRFDDTGAAGGPYVPEGD